MSAILMESSLRQMSLILLFTLLLSACSSVPPAPADRYYRLSMAAAAAAGQGEPLSGTLAIGTLGSAAVYGERAILYSESDSPNRLQHYNYHFWADPPPSLVRDHLALYLRTNRAAPAVVVDRGEAEWRYLLNGRVHRFERMLLGSGSKVVVEMEFSLLQRGGRQPLLIKDYSAEVKVDTDSVHSASEAFSAALGEIYQQLLADIRRHGG